MEGEGLSDSINFYENSEYDDLELNKIYPVIKVDANNPENYRRIIDESEEDYIYPKEMFEVINLPVQVQNRVMENIAA